ncbi:hypothetical protein HPB50_027665 [Hyalomma asiaticum]|nr:hypothetical protein HPB50_027665 [Hyalomma asiaticum]
MRLTNCPFAYILQFVFGLLIGTGDVRLGTTGAAATAPDQHARNDHAPTLPTPIFDYQLHQLTGTTNAYFNYPDPGMHSLVIITGREVQVGIVAAAVTALPKFIVLASVECV